MILLDKKEKWRVKNIDTETLNKLQIEKEGFLYEKTIYLQNNYLESSSSIILIEEDNQNLLELKGIKSYLQKCKPEILETRICMGFLNKKGDKTISSYKKRWFILISSVPLVNFMMVIFLFDILSLRIQK